MTEQCEHKWHFFEESKDGCFCVKGCRGRLSRAEAESRLNEYETLKELLKQADLPDLGEEYEEELPHEINWGK